MTVIKINALTVPDDAGDELAARFAARLGAVDGQDGFEGFELLRPNDGRNQWLVLSRWRDDEAFEAWTTSASFAHGHGAAPSGAPQGGHGGGATHGGPGGPPQGGPLSTASEVWSFDIAGGSPG